MTHNASFPNDSLSESQDAEHDEHRIHYWKLILIILPLLMIFGNVLVLVVVMTEHTLRTPTNYFLCSLAVSDIMVGLVVMPFEIYQVVTGLWDLGQKMCNVFLASDLLASTASILNLTAICVDRYIAVAYPVRYSRRNNKVRIVFSIAIVWIVSAGSALPVLFDVGVKHKMLHNRSSSTHFDTMCDLDSADLLIYDSIISFYVPATIIILLYCRIYRIIKQQSLKKSSRTLRSVTCTESTVFISSLGSSVDVKGAGRHGAPPVGVRNTRDTRMETVYDVVVAATAVVPQTPPATGMVKGSPTNLEQVAVTTLAGTSQAPLVMGMVKGSATDEQVAVTTHACASQTPLVKEMVKGTATDLEQVAVTPLAGASQTPLTIGMVKDSSTNLEQVAATTPAEASQTPLTARTVVDITLDLLPVVPAFPSENYQHQQHPHEEDHNCPNTNGDIMFDLGICAADDESCASFQAMPDCENLHQHLPHERHDQHLQQLHEYGEICVKPVLTPAPAATVPEKRSLGFKIDDPPLRSDVMGCAKRDNVDKPPVVRTSKAILSKEVKKKTGTYTEPVRSISIAWQSQSTSLGEKKASQTVAIVLSVFLICWTPTFVLNIFVAVCMKKDLSWGVCKPSGYVRDFFVWLGFTNSLINPVVYTIFSVKFRNAFLKILSGACLPKKPVRMYRKATTTIISMDQSDI